MESLTKRLQPLLSGAVSLSGLDQHTKEALDIFVHFKGAQIAESLDPERIKAELAKVQEAVRELVTQETRIHYKRLLKHRH